MQILASALPGFRDLRAPVIAGYMWLVLAWLLVEPDLSHPPQTGISGSLYDLFAEIGSIWVAIVASVVAYLLGSVSQEISKGLRAAWQEVDPRLRPSGIQRDHRLRTSFERGAELIRQADLSANATMELEHRLERRAQDAETEARRELELPATLLVGDQSELFAEVDRLRAEGELRMTVVPPLTGLAVYLSLQGSIWWLLLIPLIVVLFVQGIQREQDSRKSIADAIWIGRVESSSGSKLSQWVDDVFPKEIATIRALEEND